MLKISCFIINLSFKMAKNGTLVFLCNQKAFIHDTFTFMFVFILTIVLSCVSLMLVLEFRIKSVIWFSTVLYKLLKSLLFCMLFCPSSKIHAWSIGNFWNVTYVTHVYVYLHVWCMAVWTADLKSQGWPIWDCRIWSNFSHFDNI